MLGISVFLACGDALRGLSSINSYPELHAPATAERLLMAIQAQQKL